MPEALTPEDAAPNKLRYEAEEVAVTAWKFGTASATWQFQVTAKSEAFKRSGNGYLLLTLNGAAQLWRELGHALKDRGVIP